jgi:flagellar basal-body rod protein FlgB
MPGDFILDGTTKLLEQTLNWHSQGQAIIAGNLANLDTPNYTSKEVDFKGVLKDHLQGRPGIKLAATDPKHLPGSQVEGGLARNTRQSPDLDQEMVNLSLNQIGYQTSVTMLTKKLEQLKTMITGQ